MATKKKTDKKDTPALANRPGKSQGATDTPALSRANPNLPGAAAQTAGFTEDKGFGGARGGGTGDSVGGAGTLPGSPLTGERGGSAEGADHPA